MKSKMILSIFADLLHDLHVIHTDWFSHRAFKLTVRKLTARLDKEGVSFLTKQLPRLGKCLDLALCQGTLDCVGFERMPKTKLPRFLGEFFRKVFHDDGRLLDEPNVLAIQRLRQVLFLAYKYELPYEHDQEKAVLDNFIINDSRLPDPSSACSMDESPIGRHHQIVAKRLLARVFANFDPRRLEVVPRHGPGSVATGEQAWEKWTFKRIYAPIEAYYPFTEYFVSGGMHLCDTYTDIQKMDVVDGGTAKVVLVPKDSRGPRLISMEPLEYQFIQQGLGRSIMQWVESHPLTRGSVNFTSQEYNRSAALRSSMTGEYATIDMKDASDLVSLSLVRALFPPHMVEALEAVRTSATLLPDGRKVVMKKYAPMGSCLCFPVEALCFWAILVADRIMRLGSSDKFAASEVLVFGDDIIVPARDSELAMKRLEDYYLKVNTSKSCTKGFFRESCGVDAYKGIDVTPLRLKQVWRHRRDPSVYSSYIAFINAMYQRGYRTVAYSTALALARIYGSIPRRVSGDPSVPSLCFDAIGVPEPRVRFKRDSGKPDKPYYSRKEEYVWYIVGTKHLVSPDRWSELFRAIQTGSEQVRAGSYTAPHRSMLRRGWRRT
jgi:hypothetical protein